ncbi:MAG: helicase-related protein, partial [Bacteroidia bacterium]|nr:helicase-related protein [Bacteroidia bacterium]
LEKAGGVIVEQIVRPTGLLDPPVEVRPLFNQVDDLIGEIDKVTREGNRVLVTTLTKRMSEELARYLSDLQIKVRYIHSEIDSLERVEILRDLRLGKFDVLVGINLLREGLDLPEVSLVAILDADKEGFLRSTRAFIQIAGRAARNADGRVILYADKITDSMKKLIDETERRRAKQIAYNKLHGITPKTVSRTKEEILNQPSILAKKPKEYDSTENTTVAADPVVLYMTIEQLHKAIDTAKKRMEDAAKQEEYLQAARFRDELYALQAQLKQKLSAVENTI